MKHLKICNLPNWMLAFALLPSLLLFFNLCSNQRKMSQLKEAMVLQSRAVALWENGREKEIAYTERFLKADPDYLENKLLNLVLFPDEGHLIEGLPEYLKSKNESRLQTENRPRLIPSLTRNNGEIEESELRLDYPIELSDKALTELLVLIEEEHPDKPDLLIKKISLQKKGGGNEDEKFLIDIEIIKRLFK